MAKAALNSAQMVPRFLLPQLSWQAPAQRQALRALSTLSPGIQNPSNSRHYTIRDAHQCTRPNVAPRSRTSILQNASHHRAFHATARQARDHHFDTLKFVQRLQEEGFTETQAVAMMKVLSDVIEERFLFSAARSLTSR